MRLSFAVLAFLVLPVVHAAERKEIYAQQLDCATEKFLKTAVGGAANVQLAAAAADACVTRQDTAAIYKGFKRYEERDPATVRKEIDERKKMVVDEVLHRYQTCQRDGLLKNRAVQACSDFFRRNNAG